MRNPNRSRIFEQTNTVMPYHVTTYRLQKGASVKIEGDGNKVLRDILFDQCNLCRHCGCRMVLPHGSDARRNVCTIEHIYPKTDLRRLTVNGDKFKSILCQKCNNEKGTYDSWNQMQKRYEQLHPPVDLFELIVPFKSFTGWLKSIKN